MSECNFKIPFAGNSNEIIDKAQAAVEGQGGTFIRNETGGSFHANILGNEIAGNYQLHTNEVELTIMSKPFFVPCSTIEQFLLKQVG